MDTLIAVISSGKGTWAHVLKVIEGAEWDKIIIITNSFGDEKFSSSKEFERITLNFDDTISKQRDLLLKLLKPKIRSFDVGVNFVSGQGKEHMALMSALMQLGVGIRLVAYTEDGVKEL